MEIILKQTIDTLGLEGELVKVKAGYARNYLIPQNMAVPVNRASLARLEKEQEAITRRREDEKKTAEALSDQLKDLVITIVRKVGSENRLFGSVNTADIAEKVNECGVTIDRKAVILSEPIKSVGEVQVAVKVGYQMTTEITVRVAGENAPDTAVDKGAENQAVEDRKEEAVEE